MPLTQVSIMSGKPEAQRRAISRSICAALHQVFGVPEDDRFVTITEHHPSDFLYSPASMGVSRTDDLIIVRITANRGRTLDQKKGLYARLAALLVENAGVRPEDVLVSLVEVDRENWSLGAGLAQLA